MTQTSASYTLVSQNRIQSQITDGETVKLGNATKVNTCSKAGLLFSLSQVAVGVEVGSRWRLCRLGPTFPFYEMGDPALSQGGGLRHMVPHCLRDTWTQSDTCQASEDVSQETWNMLPGCKSSLPFKEDLASAANSWMPTLFRESAGDFPDLGIISLSLNFTCKKDLSRSPVHKSRK